MDIGAKMARGAMWMVAWRITDRSIGVISTVVLARLLVPADFGLVAMATSVIAFLEILTAFSFDTALIQNQRSERVHYDTAWTLAVLFGLFNACVLATLAVPAAHFYATPRLESVLYCLAVTSALGGFSNVGIVAFRKELQLNKEFQFQVARRLIMLVVTISLALLFRSYWALVIAQMISSALGVGISYLMHPYRPRFSLAGGKDLFHFSKWLVLTNFLTFMHNRGVDFIIGRVLGARSLGLYSIAYEVSNLPTTELVAPITRATFPGYTKISLDPAALRLMFLKVTAVIALITVPIGMGIASMSGLIVPIALGSRWADASPLLAVLAFCGVIYSLQSNSGAVLLAFGKLRTLASILAIQTVLLLPALVWGARQGGTLGVAIASVVTGIALAPINLVQVFRAIGLRYRDYLGAIWRPLLAAALMYGLVELVQRFWGAETIIEQLQEALVLMILGAAVYIAADLVLWRLASCPPGAEEYMLEKLQINRLLGLRKAA